MFTAFYIFGKLNEPKNVSFFENKKIIFPSENKNKTILLLILDEYHSPDDLYRVTKDSSIYNFSSNENPFEDFVSYFEFKEEITQVVESFVIKTLESFGYDINKDFDYIDVKW